MYRVPSRTLYGRLKKMGILTTNMKKQKDKDKDNMLPDFEEDKKGEKC